MTSNLREGIVHFSTDLSNFKEGDLVLARITYKESNVTQYYVADIETIDNDCVELGNMYGRYDTSYKNICVELSKIV